VEQNTAQKVEEDKIIKETKENTVSYNNAIINE
jgi:Na+-transporting NADH:ubiquinone oxidoreductase subunit E